MTSSPASPDLLQQLLGALRRQWRTAGVVATLVALASVGALLVLPKTYQSEALLFVKVGASSVTLDPTATTGQTISLYESRETEINSILQILTSRAMLERTVDALGADVVLGDGGVPTRNEPSVEPVEPAVAESTESAAAALEPVVAATEEPAMIEEAPQAIQPTAITATASLRSSHIEENVQRAIRELSDTVHISAPKKSTVISVYCTAKSPELAQEIVATMLELYQKEHLRVNSTAGSFEFFENQTAKLGGRLATTSDALLKRKNAAGVVLLDEQRKNVEKQLSDLADRLRVAQSDMVGSTARIGALEDELTYLPETQEAERTIGISNDAYDRMRDRLYELEIRERELRSRFTESHPSVQAVLEQVREARDVVAAQAPERTQTRSIVPPARTKAQEELVHERSRKASLTALADKMEMQRKDLLGQLRQMNDEEIAISKLEREMSVLEGSYHLAAEKLEQARIQQALASEHVSNVNVFQPASYDTKPVSPKTSAVLGAGLALAILSFVGVAWMLDRFDDTVRSARDLERRLRIPSLATLPRAPAREMSWN